MIEQKKKILIISMAYFPRFVGGAEVAIKEITDRLGSDFEFHMITLRYDSSLPKESREGNIFVHRIGLSAKNPSIADLRKLPLRFLKPWFQFGAFYAAKKLHKKHHFDAVWGMMSHSAGIPSALLKIKYPSIKYLLTLQEGDPPEYIERQMRIFGGLFSLTFTKADAIQTLSHFLANWAQRRGGKNISVIPNGVTLEQFSKTVSSEEIQRIRKEIGAGENDTVLVTLSRLVKKNGVDTVIEVLPLIPQVRFLVAGDGPERKPLEQLAEKMGVSNRVVFLGEYSQEQMPAILASSNIFIRASRSEGQGIAFIEAMASGLPTIGTNVGGIPDFLHEGKTGFLAEPKNIQSVADAVNRAMRDGGDVARGGKALVESHYQWDMIVTQMKNLFNSLWQK